MIGSSDMQICGALTGGRLEHPLNPISGMGFNPNWSMICEVFNLLVANMAESPRYGWIEILYCDLNVDAVLGSQTGNGSRTNMIDTQRQISERSP